MVLHLFGKLEKISKYRNCGQERNQYFGKYGKPSTPNLGRSKKRISKDDEPPTIKIQRTGSSRPGVRTVLEKSIVSILLEIYGDISKIYIIISKKKNPFISNLENHRYIYNQYLSKIK